MLVSQSGTLWFLPNHAVPTRSGQHLRHHGSSCWYLSAITRVSIAQFGDGACAGGMVIAAGKECRPRRRAQRGSVKTCVAQARVGKTIQIGCGDLAAERTPLSEAAVLDQYEQDVRRSVG